MAFLLAACRVDPTSTLPATGTSPAPLATRTRAGATQVPVSTSTSTSTPASILPLAAEDLQGVRIRFWHAWDGSVGREIQALISEFNSGNQLGIQVETVFQGSFDDLSAGVLDALKVGQPPDLALGYAFQALEWDTVGKVVDLSPYVNDPNWGLPPETQSGFYEAFW